MYVKLLSSAATLALIWAVPTLAVTQGTTGSTSSGTVQVSMTIAEDVKISNLSDVTAGAFTPGGGDVTTDIPACIYYNNASSYDLTLSSANSAGPGYQVAFGGSNIGYGVEFQEDRGGAGPFATHTEASTQKYSGANTAAPNCGGGNNVTFRVVFTDPGTTYGVPNGTYEDTITFLVSPNP